MGQLLSIKDQMHAADSQLAPLLDQVQGISPANAQESKLKDVMKILFLRKIQQRDTLQAAEYTLLSALAAECPFISGPAVYSARNLLFETQGEQYWNDCEDYTPYTAGVQQRIKIEEVAIEVKVYPNPTNGSINIDLPLMENQYGSIEIFDTRGREIKKQKLLNTKQKISFTLSPGFYFYKIKINGEIIKSDKLMIVN